MPVFFEIAWLLLCVCTGVTAGHVSATTTPGLCAGKPVMEKLDKMEGVLNSLQQTQQRLCSVVGYEPSTERLGLKKKMSVLEAKLEAVETKLGATETKLEAAEANLKATDKELQSTKALLQAKMKGGSTFVRWGRKTCTSASELVYSGVGAGGYWSHSGAAANMLCLTMKPKSKRITLPRKYTYIYGAEYQNIPNHHDHDVPCSVCRATQSTTIMIPATRFCPTGWTTQYTGHLVAGHHTDRAATEYVCLDGYLEHMPSGHQNHDGHLLYYTFAQCGSLPCPPYSNMAIVLCVVCSK